MIVPGWRMEKETDLRVKKTKRNIHNAFFMLAVKKRDVRKITVKEICTLAECGRSTFYMYYPYKDALYEEVVEAALNGIMDGFKPLDFELGSWRDVSEEYLRNVLSALYQIKKLFPIIPPGSESFNAFTANLTDRIIAYSDQLAIQMYHIQTHENLIKIYALNRAVLSGIINEAVYCFSKTDYSVEFVHDLIRPLFLAYNEEIEKIRTEECQGPGIHSSPV